MSDFHMTLREAAKHGVNIFWAANSRIRFLESEIKDMQDRIATGKMKPMGLGIMLVWIKDREDEIDYLNRRKESLKNKDKPLMKLTDEQIAIANAYPLEQLIDFQNGKAMAWCHPDKNPSLTYWRKGNKAKCWVCEKYFSPIDVLIKRDGMSFVEAVKMLN